MIKRFLSAALIVGLLFSMGTAAFAANALVSETVTGVSADAPAAAVRYRQYKGTGDYVDIPVKAWGFKLISDDSDNITESDSYNVDTFFALGTSSTYVANVTYPLQIDGLSIDIAEGKFNSATTGTRGAHAGATIRVSGYPTKSVATGAMDYISFYVFAAANSTDSTPEYNRSSQVRIPVYGLSYDMEVSFESPSGNKETNEITYSLDLSGSTNTRAITFIAPHVTNNSTNDKFYWYLDIDDATVLKYLGSAATFNDALVTDGAVNAAAKVSLGSDAAGVENNVKLQFIPSAIGSFTFKVKAVDAIASKDAKVEYAATSTYTVTISGDAPVITVSADATTDVSGHGLATNTNNTEITADGFSISEKIYDKVNKVIYTGKVLSYDKAMSSDADIVFIARGSSQDMTFTGTITPAGSGLYLSADADVDIGQGGMTTKTMAGYDKDVASNGGSWIIRGVEKKFYLRGTAATAGTYNINLTAKNAASDVSVTKTYTFTIAAAPVITSANTLAVTWHDSVTFTPKGTNVDSWDIAISDDYVGTPLKASTKGLALREYILGVHGSRLDEKSGGIASLDAGATFDHKTGKLTFDFYPGYGRTDLLNFGGANGDKEFTRKIRLLAYRGDGDGAAFASQDVTITFTAIAPIMSDSTSELTSRITAKKLSWDSTFGDAGFGIGSSNTCYYPLGYDSNGNQTHADGYYLKAGSIVMNAVGPGEITWTVENLPAGLTWMTSQDKGVDLSEFSWLVISGTPKITAKNHVVTITAKNDVGSTTIEPSFNIGHEKNNGNLAAVNNAKGYAPFIPSGDHKVNEVFRTVTVSAEPGPITWTTSNLPAGITLSVDAADGTVAKLVGSTYTTATTKTNGKFNSRYILTATNSVIGKSTTMSEDLVVYALPALTTASLPALTTHKDYTAAIAATGYPKSWDIKIANSTAAFNANGSSYVSLDIVKYSDDCSEAIYIVGSLDRVPENGSFYVRATAWNPAGYTDAADFEISVNGTAPKATNTSVTLKREAQTGPGGIVGTNIIGSSVDVKVDGDLPITLTATIEGSKARTIFGDQYAEEGIDLSTWANNPTGILFSPDFDVSGDLGTGKLILSGDFSYAYTDLPITITAVNPIMAAVPAKFKSTSSATYKVTVNGAAPKWYMVSNDASGVATSTDLSALSKLDKAFATERAIVNPYITATDQGFYFFLSGDKPLEYTIKPTEETKGVTVTLNETTGVVTVTGTPDEATKDTKIGITLQAKNPSTKKVAKLAYNFVARPLPKFDDEELFKETTLGKKLSIKPKMTATTKDIVYSVSASDAEILENYGLELDPKKGTISGTTTDTTRATGSTKIYESKDITLIATNEVGSVSKDVHFGIKGAKPKLTSKKFDDLVVNTAYEGTLTTNLGESVTSRISFDTDNFTGALAGFKFDNPATGEGNGAIFSGTPSAAVKKHSVTFKMFNVGTEATGKVSFTVADPAPVPAASPNSVTLSLGESGTVDLSLTADPTGDTAINWKVKTKPTGGVKATIKKDGNNATLTIKAPKKATADISTSVVVTATNKVTKAVGEVEVAVTVNADSTSKAPEDVLDTTTAPEEAAAEQTTEETPVETPEETADAEAKLTLGAERSAASLTAGQRAEIEEAGYVIAAILPEITVNKSGQYDLEVTLDEAAPAGAELKWFAFPADGVKNEDDEIVDFYNAEGEETAVVPEDHVVTVVPWFRADVTYSPVIAVKVENADGAKDTVEDAANGDVVTEKALEEAAAAPESETHEAEAPATEAE